MSNQWLRLWHDMPNDPKWRTIARISGQRIGDVIAIYNHLLVSASMNTERGVTQCDADDLASALDLTTEAVNSILQAMQGKVLEENNLTGWETRQPKREDNSRDRTTKYRQLKKEERSVTQCDAPEKIKIREDKDKKERKKGTRFALTTLPDDWVAYCREKRPDLNPQSVFEDFRDYWIAEPDGVKLNWDSTWQRWVRNQRGNKNATNNQNRKSTWKSEAERLSAKYAAEAEREEQAAANPPDKPNLLIAEAIRQN